MSKFRWLTEYRKLQSEIEILEFSLERSKNELKRWTHGDLTKIKLTADSDGAKLEEHIELYEYELAHKMNDLHDFKKMINKFPELENKIIYHKYVEGMTLETIAELLGYSTQYIYNKHAQIKKMIDFVGSFA